MSKPNTMLRLSLVLVALSACWPFLVTADVLISELADPRLNYASDRFIEIYNSGDGAVDLTDWQLVAVANGADVFTWHLSGLIDAHQALVAGDATTAVTFTVAFPDEAWSGATGSWNGKVGDGARLVDPDGLVTDSVVATGTAFENSDYVRNMDIGTPNPIYTPTEWTRTAVDLATDASPGTHHAASGPVGPVIASTITDPVGPVDGDEVNVLANVTDAEANITTVVLEWGTTPTSLPNVIDMPFHTGDTYRTIAPIPAQASGATVYYRVKASNDLPATTSSQLQSYDLAFSVSVHEIQGESSASPYDGLVVTTHGVVTASFGTTFVIQDGIGPWSGLWVHGTESPAPGDSLTLTGRVTESNTSADLGHTLLVGGQIMSRTEGAALPAATSVTTAEAGSEPYEGVLVRVSDAVCMNPDIGGGEWLVDDGSGACGVGALGNSEVATLGTTYELGGSVSFESGRFMVQPRGPGDVLWVADDFAPTVSRIATLNSTTLRVVFSEAVDPFSTGVAENYVVSDLVVSGATHDPENPGQVVLTVTEMVTGDYELSVSGVEDLHGNAMAGAGATFSYYSPDIPPGYYDTANGLTGDALLMALHDIIKDHVAHSYTYAWTAYETTDVRPVDGKVWDVYSDIPGGTPPYLYTFGVNEGGVGGAEGTGYTREHTWCKSWFGGEVSPMYTDLFALYPCDTHMNGTRGIFAYGETSAPQLISLNGSMVGPSSVPGYTGTVFEPIDEFKGDLARAYLYFSTRYYLEDAGWPGGPATDGAEIKPWALEMFLQWIDNDPVSQKEIDRNTAIYLIQGNRNPYVDHPEFVETVYSTTLSTGEDDSPEPDIPTPNRLYHATPNPFNPTTRVRYDLEYPEAVILGVFDIKGRLVRRLSDGTVQSAGRHEVIWDGRSDDGNRLPSGTYFCRLEAGDFERTIKMALLK